MGAVTTTIRVKTAARYRGLTVTVLGDARAGLLAIAGYGTAQELAIAAIDVKRRGGHRVFAVVGTAQWTPHIAVVAATAAALREQRDVDELGTGQL